ncbi:CpaF family protein [Pseudomonas aeruginosa]|uniref:CpaF family protein n=1 Tax=Pseudomonas aeruginosa TaxID=287 RepID=UPI000F5287E3|nr:ATPase, T2SS/T4P/T4SS family [Pseudomonas aeruginosa]RQA67818.1 secretion system protein E [Pseudomonas aeruginosa]
MSMVETAVGMVPESDSQGWELLLHYFSPVMQYYLDEAVTEIMVNRYDEIWIERGGHLERVDATFGTERALQEFIYQVGNRLNQLVDEDNPILDARFPDGSRLCCTLPTVTPGGSTITLRCKPRQSFTFEDLVGFGALTPEMVDYIRERVQAGDTMLVSGNTGSGKTTVLRACAAFIDKRERVISAEDTMELHLKQMLPGAVEHEAPKRRPKDGVQPVTLASLIKLMLRERPDRGWVGEIRDAAAADAFLQLSNTGHTGGASSLHANGPADAVRRIQYMIAAAGLVSYELAGHQVLGGVQLLIHCARSYKWGRKVTHICRIEDEKIIPVFLFDEVELKHVRVG